MNAARPSDGLLPAATTVTLVELLARRPEGASVEHLLRDLAATTSISWSRARNTITKLISYDLLLLSGQSMVRLIDSAPEDARRWITDRIVADLTTLLTRANAWSCVGRDPRNGQLMIDAMTLPPIKDGLAMWVTDFGVAERAAIQARFWTVAAEFTDAFIKGARDANLSPTRRAKSAERLAADLERQAKLGEEAEVWVVEFERERLREHPLRDQVRRISSDDVSAGYDIVSFTSALSIRHDRFIEVKSHGGQKVFHWSRNEIATAVEFGEEYALYLVDRTKCGEPGYAPHVITGPTPDLFVLPDSGWRVEATSFEHTALSS